MSKNKNVQNNKKRIDALFEYCNELGSAPFLDETKLSGRDHRDFWIMCNNYISICPGVIGGQNRRLEESLFLFQTS